LLIRLLLLFVTVPLMELALLLWLSSITSIWFTLATVVVTGIAGSLLARSQGFSTWRKIQREMSGGQMPGSSLIDAAMIFAAGALMMTPGLLTDGLGFALLIPACRNWMKKRAMEWAKKNIHVQTTQFQTDGTAQKTSVVDSHVVTDQKPDQS